MRADKTRTGPEAPATGLAHPAPALRTGWVGPRVRATVATVSWAGPRSAARQSGATAAPGYTRGRGTRVSVRPLASHGSGARTLSGKGVTVTHTPGSLHARHATHAIFARH